MPNCLAQVWSKPLSIFSSPGCLSVIRFSRLPSGSSVEAFAIIWLCILNPTGTCCSIAIRTRRKLSGNSLAVSDKRTAFIPQPISTPTAAGIMADLVGMTLPTVAPLPKCTSGITAMCECTNSSFAILRNCSIASGAMSLVYTLTGTPCFSFSFKISCMPILSYLNFY